MEITTLASSSKGNAYIVTDGAFPLLIEAGIPWKQIRQKLNFQTSSIAGCLISHSHADHSKSWQGVAKAGIDIYTSQGTIDALGMTGHRIKPIEPLCQFQIGNWKILPFPTEHDCEGSMGFLLANQVGEKLLFITDSFYSKYCFSGITHLMIETNHSYEILTQNVEAGLIPQAQKNRLIQSHFSLENVKKFLLANDLSKVKSIHLLHLSEGNSDAEQFKREVQELTGKSVIVAGE